MQPFPALEDLQRLLSRLIRAPEGVAAGVTELVSRGELESADLSFAIAQSDRMTPSERLDVYANMYFYRLHDCIAQDYPEVLAQIGDAKFHNLITDYLLVHPPSHYSLREAGAALPGFLFDHKLTAETPALADLARLEWARVDVFDDEDARPLDRETFLAASAEDPEAFSFRLIPAARVLSLDESALVMWRQSRAESSDEALPQPDPTGNKRCVVVWRKGFAVFHREVVEDEEDCLGVLAAAGITLPELAERLLKPDASAERTSERFAALLELWLGDELVTGPPSGDTAAHRPRVPTDDNA
jgi:hypothetical protein